MTANRNPKQRSPQSLNHVIPSLEQAVQASNARWTRDLGALYEHARERFGDVSWADVDVLEGNVRLGANSDDTIWGHKAIVYARAPKPFKDKYFGGPSSSASSPSSSSPIPGYSTSDGPNIPPRVSSATVRPRRRSSANDDDLNGRGRAGSNASVVSGFGAMASASVLRLTHGGTPETLRAQLKWLYTAEGNGDIASFLDSDSPLPGATPSREGRGAGLGLGLLTVDFEPGLRTLGGKRDGKEEGRERLGQDLTYMWRSKLYADVKIRLNLPAGSSAHPPVSYRTTNGSAQHLPLRRRASASSINLPLDPSEAEYDQDGEDGPQVALFSAHRFVLCSRCPYFAQVLLNSGSFQPHPASRSVRSTSANLGSTPHQTPEIILPSPPFTPATLHFVLGYLYAGTLSFSNRTIDLSTAFGIYRAAAFLEIDELLKEVEARIVWEFCHGIVWDRERDNVLGSSRTDDEGLREERAPSRIGKRSGGCSCRKCVKRIPRVWRFATSVDVGAIALGERARTYILRGWGDCWGRDVGDAPEEARAGLVRDVIGGMADDTDGVVEIWRRLRNVKSRMEVEVSHQPPPVPVAGKAGSTWVDNLGAMLVKIERRATTQLTQHLQEVIDSKDFAGLLDGRNFEADLLETLLAATAASCGRPETWATAGKVYQTVVSSLLLKTVSSGPDAEEDEHLALPMGSAIRQAVEGTREDILKHLKRRWMAIKEESGFNGLEVWALKEISDEIEVSMDDLQQPSGREPRKPVNRAAALRREAAGTTKSISSSASVTSVASSRPASVATRVSAVSTVAPSAATRRTATAPAPAARTDRATTSTLRPRPPVPASSASSIRRSRSSGNLSAMAEAAESAAPLPVPALKVPAARTRVLSSATASSAAKAISTKSDAPPKTRPGAGRNVAGPSKPAVPAARPTKASATEARIAPVPLNPRPRSLSAASIRSKGKGKAVEDDLPSPPLPKTPKSPTAASRFAAAQVRPGSVRSMASTQSTATAKGKRPEEPIPQVPQGRVAAAKAALANTTMASKRPDPKAPGGSTTPSLRSKASISSIKTDKTTRAATKTPPPPLPTPKTPTKPSGTPTAKQPMSPSLKVTPTTARARTTSTTSTLASVSRGTVRQPVAVQPTVPPVQTRTGRQDGSASTDDGHSEAATPSGSVSDLAQQPMIRRSPSNDSAGSELPAADVAAPFPPLSSGISLASLQSKSSIADSKFSQRTSGQEIRRTRTPLLSTTPSTRAHPASAFDPPKPKPKLAAPSIQVDDGTRPSNAGVSLGIGIPCIISLTGKRARFKALCRYVGRMQDRQGPWVGVEVADHVGSRYEIEEALGDGSIGAIRYFRLGQGLDDPADETDPDLRAQRRRKIDDIGNNFLGKNKLPVPGYGTVRSQYSDPISRSSTPAPNDNALSEANWIGITAGAGTGTRALFVRPTEVVFVPDSGD